MSKSISGNRKSIFITGAASGIGRATAALFADKDWFVGAVDINEDGLKSLKKELGQGNCFVRRMDVRDKTDYDRAVVEFGKTTGGRMDILFNNAGVAESGWFEDVPYEAGMNIVKTNLIGVLNGIYAALPLLKATPNALCFTTSSSSGTYGMPGIAIYSATKHAVKGLTEALSIEFQRFGIRAADVLPGSIDTPVLFDSPKHSPEMQGRPVQPKTGIFRLLPPSKVAQSVWNAYHSDKLHWYVPPRLSSIDKLKGLSPELARKQIMKMILSMTTE
jgi:NAD(P)-dependent dehydrogenase (short-subunit alcohol dehydrogenase family)